jgi:hypothetical protein
MLVLILLLLSAQEIVMKTRSKQMSKWMVFLGLFFSCLQVSAHKNDILIIDLNNAVPEIEFIRNFIKKEQRAGRELETEIVLWPSEQRFPMEKRRLVHEIFDRHVNKYAQFVETKCGDSQTARNPQLKEKCDQAAKEIIRGRTEANRLFNLPEVFEKMTNKVTANLAVNELPELRSLVQGPYEFSRIFISGHHSLSTGVRVNGVLPESEKEKKGGIFGEVLSGLKSTDLRDVLNNAPSTRNVRSLMILGCYSGTQEMLQEVWGPVLPEAKLHSGFVEQAPAKTDPVDMIILDSLLKYEQSIAESKNATELRQRYKQIRAPGRQVAFKVENLYISPAGVKNLE